MNNQDYWRKRTAEREAHWHDLTTAELTKLRRYYKAAAKELEREAATLYAKYATENGLTITEARKLIRGDEFKEWRMSLREYVAAAKGDPKLLRELNTLAMRSRISRVEAIHARTLTELIELGNRLQDTTDEHLYRAYLDNYYGTLYDFHKTIGLQTPPAAVDRPRVESVLQTKWSGKNYSARIWTNTRKLATEVQQTILQAIHRGYPIQRLSKNLAQRMNVAYTNAERLILTELNAVETRASADAMKAADFDYYQFVATLDRRTCPICGERDGEVYPLSSMNQGENAPPMHPRCRCTIIASIDDGKQGRKTTDQRAAEGRSRVPADMSYRDWLKSLTPSSKIRAGLSAGERSINFAEGGKSPRLIGNINPEDAEQVKRAITWFESVAVKAPVEHAMIITTSGDIYHCSGGLNTLEPIIELDEKLYGAIVTHNHPAGSDNEYSFSKYDWYLFRDYKLARLRGVDEMFVYEFNRNVLDTEEVLSTGEANEFNYRHSLVAQLAKDNSIGYRRWRR